MINAKKAAAVLTMALAGFAAAVAAPAFTGSHTTHTAAISAGDFEGGGGGFGGGGASGGW
jgi:hypothetical protein